MSNNKKSPLLDLIDDITSFPTEGLTMEERAGLVNALKNKLKSMEGSESDVLDNLKPAVRKRSELLTDVKSKLISMGLTDSDVLENLNLVVRKRDKVLSDLQPKESAEMIDVSTLAEISYTEMLILWDFNNLPLVKIQFLRKAMLELFPGIKLKIKAYANQITPTQLKVCESVGANVTFVSSEVGEADRVMMIDLFEYAYDHAAPNWVMVITTDSDFAGCLQSVSYRMYGTVLVCDTVRASKELKHSAQYCYDWNNLEEISEKLREPPAEVCAAIAIYNSERRLANGSNNTIVFWNIEALPAPSGMHQDDAIRILMEQIIKPYIQDLKPVPFHVYGNLFLPPISKQAKDVEYIIARDNPQDKARSIENLMLRHMLSYAYDNSAPSNIFIIDNNVNLKSPILSLTSRGFEVFLVGAPDVSAIKYKDTKQTSQHHLRGAASLCLDFPDFTGCYTPV